MDYAFRALARRMHTSMELREKLRKRPHHSKELEDLILARLAELKLIDDEAFLKRHIENAQHSRHEGYLKTAFKLKLKGSCGCCPMSSMTLKNGIEKILRQEVPEIKEVVAL